MNPLITILLFDFWNVLAFDNERGNGIIFNKKLLEFVEQQTIPTHVFSNSPTDFLAQVHSQLVPPFVSVLSSKELGLSKSNPSDWQHVADMLKVSPENILFVDDQTHNVEAAQQAGLQTILFESADQFIRKVTKLLI